MSRPKVYIHRISVGQYDRYMKGEPDQVLDSFADVVRDDSQKPEALQPDEIEKNLKGCDAIISLNGSGVLEITEDVLKKVRSVKVAAIAHWWHGFHEKAWEAWTAAGVRMFDCSDACNEAVAEWSLGAMIAGLRRFELFDRKMKNGVKWPERKKVADQLTGSTVGIVGLGRVGRILARFLSTFDVRILGFDKYVSKDDARKLHVDLVDLPTLLKESDAVSLHLPVTDETKGMLGANELAMMKDGALLVNSARAALYDNDALKAELSKGRIRAYLDVFQPEPPPEDDPLRKLENVVLTPHVAGHTDKMFTLCGLRSVNAIKRYFGK